MPSQAFRRAEKRRLGNLVGFKTSPAISHITHVVSDFLCRRQQPSHRRELYESTLVTGRAGRAGQTQALDAQTRKGGRQHAKTDDALLPRARAMENACGESSPGTCENNFAAHIRNNCASPPRRRPLPKRTRRPLLPHLLWATRGTTQHKMRPPHVRRAIHDVADLATLAM